MNTIGSEELLWVLFAAVGLGVQVTNYLEARGDRKVVAASGPPIESTIIAEQGTRNEMVMLGVQVAFLLAGIAAMYEVPEEMGLLRRMIVLAIAFSVEGSLVVNSMLNRRDRWRIFRPEVEPIDPTTARRRSTD